MMDEIDAAIIDCSVSSFANLIPQRVVQCEGRLQSLLSFLALDSTALPSSLRSPGGEESLLGSIDMAPSLLPADSLPAILIGTGNHYLCEFSLSKTMPI